MVHLLESEFRVPRKFCSLVHRGIAAVMMLKHIAQGRHYYSYNYCSSYIVMYGHWTLHC